MRKRRVGNLMKVLLICMAFAAFFGVQAVFAADATKQEQTKQQPDQETSDQDDAPGQDETGQESDSETKEGQSGKQKSTVRAVGGQRERARAVTDRQQEIAH